MSTFTRSTEYSLDNAHVGDMVEVVSHHGDKREISEVVLESKRKVRLKNNMEFTRSGKEWGFSTDYYYGAHAYKVLDLELLLKEHAVINAQQRLKKEQLETLTLVETYKSRMTQDELNQVLPVLRALKARIESKPSSTSTDDAS